MKERIMKTSLDAAKYFLSKGYKQGICLTKKKLQKLVYYAQAWCLVFLGNPLFDDELQAWRHGAVSTRIRQEYKGFPYNSLPNPIEIINWEPDKEKVLEEVWRVYGSLSADELESLNHNELPWLNARLNLPLNARSNYPILQEDMKSYYSYFVADKEKYEISLDALDETKKIQVEQVELEFLDGSIKKIDKNKAEKFIIENLGKFKKKRFTPKRARICS